MLCNMLHLPISVHDILLLWVWDLTSHKGICITQQHLHYILTVMKISVILLCQVQSCQNECGHVFCFYFANFLCQVCFIWIDIFAFFNIQLIAFCKH